MNKKLPFYGLWSSSLLCISPISLAVNSDAQNWVDTVNPSFTQQFKSAEPSTVPNYTDGVNYSDDPETIKRESLKDSQTDEAAQLIYGLGRKPNVKDDSWFQDATNITTDPTSVIDMGDAGYTDCEDVSTPGGEYNSTESCTITSIPETRSCSYGHQIEIDPHYIYDCNNEVDITNESCSVGRKIDVTQTHNYECNIGKDVYEKSCQNKLVVSTTNTYCRFEWTKYSWNVYSNFTLVIWNGQVTDNPATLPNVTRGNFVKYETDFIGTYAIYEACSTEVKITENWVKTCQ